METYSAEVTTISDEVFLVLKVVGKDLSIPITKDLPKEIQNVFNELIKFLKNGVFQFGMEDVEDGDINYHIAKDYISHLNLELVAIYEEMKQHGLLEKHVESAPNSQQNHV